MRVECFINELRKLNKGTKLTLEGLYSYRGVYGELSLCTIDDGYELFEEIQEYDKDGNYSYILKEKGNCIPQEAHELASFLENSIGLHLELYKGGFMEIHKFTTLHICSTWGDYSSDSEYLVEKVSDKGIKLNSGKLLSFEKE